MLATALLIYAAVAVVMANVAFFCCIALDREPDLEGVARTALGWPAIATALAFGAVQFAFNATVGTYKFVRAKLSRK